MKKSMIVISALILILSCEGPDRYVEFDGYAQGGRYCVKANLRGVRTRPEKIASHIDGILSSIDRSVSGYNEGSLLSRFNRGETIVPDALFLELYEISRRYYDESEGAFDAASGPLFDIWGFGFKGGGMPSDSLVEATLEKCGSSRLRADIRTAIREDGSLSPKDILIGKGEAPRLNFNAIAQGYSCDTVASYLSSLGVRDMLVDIGEIRCCGLNPSGKGWTIGVDRPVDGNMTPGKDMQGVWSSDGLDRGIVTSGNYRKYYVLDGRKYAHTIDPRTGRPVTHNLLSATVVAKDATTADAVATWCMVIGKDNALKVLERLGLEGCLLYSEADSIFVARTPGFELTSR